MKLKTGKNSNSLSEFSEKSEESGIQGQVERLVLHRRKVNVSFTEVGGIEVIDAV